MKPQTLIFTPDFNHSIRVEADTHDHTTSDAGGILMRSVLEKTKILDFLLTGLSESDHASFGRTDFAMYPDPGIFIRAPTL